MDPVFFHTSYHIEPLKTASKAYALLRETLEKTGKAAIARVVLRTRQHLAAVLVRGGVLVLNLMRYTHELVPPKEVEVPGNGRRGGGVSDAEVKMAERLVEGMTAKWDPGEYRDDYREYVLALVKRKVRSGETHTIVEPEEGEDERRPRAEVMDLMPLLKKSLSERLGPAAGTREPSGAKKTKSKGERRRRRSA